MRASRFGWTAGVLGLVGSVLWALPVPLPAQPRAQRDRVVYCASNGNRYQRCAVPWRDARLVRQDSKSACVRDRSWGVDRDGLWVAHGCRGEFAEAGGWHHGRHHAWHQGGGRPAPGWDRLIRLQCDSNKKRYQLCLVDVGRHGAVRLEHQMSDARCTEGYSWGWNRAGVWVDHGCRARFVVDRRW